MVYLVSYCCITVCVTAVSLARASIELSISPAVYDTVGFLTYCLLYSSGFCEPLQSRQQLHTLATICTTVVTHAKLNLTTRKIGRFNTTAVAWPGFYKDSYCATAVVVLILCYDAINITLLYPCPRVGRGLIVMLVLCYCYVIVNTNGIRYRLPVYTPGSSSVESCVTLNHKYFNQKGYQ